MSYQLPTEWDNITVSAACDSDMVAINNKHTKIVEVGSYPNIPPWWKRMTRVEALKLLKKD